MKKTQTPIKCKILASIFLLLLFTKNQYAQRANKQNFAYNLTKIDSLLYISEPYAAFSYINTLTERSVSKIILSTKRILVLTTLQLFTQAIDSGNKLLEDPLITSLEEIELRTALAICYEAVGSIGKCKIELHNVHVLFKKNDMTNASHVRFLIQKSSYNQLINKTEVAEKLASRASISAQSQGFINILAKSYLLLANNSQKINFQLQMLQKAKRSYEISRNYSGIAQTFITLSEIYKNQNDTNLSNQYLDSALTLRPAKSSLYFNHILAKAHNRKAQYLSTIGAYERAYKHIDTFNKLEEITSKNKQFVNRAQSQYQSFQDRENKMQKQILQQSERRNEKIRENRWYLIFILIIFLIIPIILFKVISLIRKKHEEKQNQKDQALKISEIELKKEQIISEKNRKDLKEFKIEFLKTTAQIQTLKNSFVSSDTQDAINKLRASMILTQKDWVNFKISFERQYPEFLSTLSYKNKTLTAAELRFIMLKKINLSNQDMARSQGVSQNTIHKTSSRIRQKLGTTNEELSELIQLL
jgi:DNA-binding CsgD family transcriptional regulator/large-conductance mechanosensitive channel